MLVAGRADLAVFVAPIAAPYLRRALADPAIALQPVAYGQAIARRLEYATTATLPAGAIALDPVVPERPMQVLALEARLAIRPICTRRWSTG